MKKGVSPYFLDGFLDTFIKVSVPRDQDTMDTSLGLIESRISSMQGGKSGFCAHCSVPLVALLMDTEHLVVRVDVLRAHGRRECAWTSCVRRCTYRVLDFSTCLYYNVLLSTKIPKKEEPTSGEEDSAHAHIRSGDWHPTDPAGCVCAWGQRAE